LIGVSFQSLLIIVDHLLIDDIGFLALSRDKNLGLFISGRNATSTLAGTRSNVRQPHSCQ
jgi:hypothetical protein